MVGKSLNHYRVLERVGAGGMGVVYRARDERLGRDVALKVLPSEAAADVDARTRLLAEARLASSLNHPNICTIYEVGEAEGQAFIAMEFVQGETLSTLISPQGLPAETVLRYGEQLAAGLEHAHAHGVIHRDLKSSNVRVNAEGRSKILDFGLARRLSQAEAATAEQPDATPGGHTAVSGTLSYMAPETLRGETPDARADIWALGVILYEMATGSLPFRGTTGFAVSSAILRDPPAALPERVPPGLREVIRRCLAKEPSARYQSAGELRAALEAVHSGQTTEHYEAGASGGKRWLVAMVVAAAVLLVVAAVAYYGSRQTPKQAQHQLALLPVTLPESDPEIVSLGDGLAETANARLAHAVGPLGVLLVPASEVRARKVASLQEARDQFGVDLCVQFSLHRAGDQARVTYSLVDTASFRQFEAGTLTATAANPLALEDLFAERVIALVTDYTKQQPGEKAPAVAAEERNPDARRAEVAASSAMEAAKSSRPASAGNPGAGTGTNPDSHAQQLYAAATELLGDRYSTEKTERAISVLRQALDADPRFAPAYAGLGQAFWLRYEQTKDRGWVGQAQAACRKSMSLAPAAAAGHECLGLVAAGTGDYQSAVEEYRKALAIDPANATVAARMGEVFERQGKLQEAEASFRDAVQRDPANEANVNRLGSFYLRHGKFPDAARMFSEMIALSPTRVQGYSNLGSVYLSEGRYADAIPQYELSLAIQPTADATSNLATAYFHLRRYADSARMFEKAVKLDDKNYEAWGNLGDAYYWTPARRDDAAAAYRKAIALAEEKLKVNPKDANLLGYVASYRAMLGEKEEAAKALDAALHLAPADPDVLTSAAIVHNQFGETPETLEALQKALAAGASTSSLRDLPNFDRLRDNPRFQQLLQARPPS